MSALWRYWRHFNLVSKLICVSFLVAVAWNVSLNINIEIGYAGGCCSKPIERAARRCCSEAFYVSGTLMFALGSLFMLLVIVQFL